MAHRRDLEAEVSRLRAQVHTQTARLSVVSGDERRQENMRRRSNDLAVNLTGLERDISRLRAQRDMTLAEVEELRNSSRWVGIFRIGLPSHADVRLGPRALLRMLSLLSASRSPAAWIRSKSNTGMNSSRLRLSARHYNVKSRSSVRLGSSLWRKQQHLQPRTKNSPNSMLSCPVKSSICKILYLAIAEECSPTRSVPTHPAHPPCRA